LTEVPEHLLKRSRDRRAALGLGGGDAGGDAAPAAEAAAASTAVTPAAAAAPATAPVVEAKAPEPPPFIPPYVEAARGRKRVPVWAMPVLAFIPFWAVLYAQSLSAPPKTTLTQLDAGAVVYGNCSTCHGGSGEGGAGRPLNQGLVIKTFPNIADQLQFVRLGDAGTGGKYGSPATPGGQHDAGAGYNGGHMPAWPNLTDTELLEVVRHERETLSGETGDFKVAADGTRQWPNGKPMLDASGKLVWDDGTAMFDASGHLTKQVDPSVPPS
jgi:hypothetical protein